MTHPCKAVIDSTTKQLIHWGYSPLVADEGEEVLVVPQAAIPPSAQDVDPGPWYWHEETYTWESTAP